MASGFDIVHEWRKDMIQKVVVDDGGGHWIDNEGELMTTVWTSEGWLDLPDS